MFWIKRAFFLTIIGGLVSAFVPQHSMAFGFDRLLGGSSKRVDNIEVAFSPSGGITDMIVHTISTAQKSVHVAAYSFTSKPVAKALLEAHKRGVEVLVVVDKSQKAEKYTSATFLANVGIPVRVDSMHSIQHNKFLVVDGKTVQMGSFNYTSAAEKSNAENAIVIHDNPGVAALYEADWKEHWNHSEPFPAKYR